LDSYPYIGIYNTYSLDGYVYEINPNNINLTKIQFDLINLYQMNWINGETRAVFINFVTYNVNINLFAYITILFEILPTGNIIKSIQINTINLYRNTNNLSILFIVYFILITITLIKEIPIMIKNKFKYLKQFWNLIETIIIILSVVSFALSFNVFNSSNKQTIINRNNRYSIMKFRQLNDKIQILIVILSLNCLLSTIKLIRILKFNMKIFVFTKMLKSCFNNLFNCCFIFLIFMFAFIQLMYLLFNNNVNDFKSFLSSIMTVFNMLLTRTPISYLNNSLLILPFFLILDFILLTLMIIVLEDTYKSFKNNNNNNNNKSFSLSFANVIHLFKSMFKLSNKENKQIKYIEKDILKEFTISSNRLISTVSKVNIKLYKLSKLY